ncbi:MAG: SDR family oxidoreductase [Ferruginibacter sp.]|jgi:NAD(P)-dependent dehydrogenase (short-subunit alcohol dehydrogenase family)
MDKIFQHKVAIITGASFGIGRATAIAFAQRGAKLVLADWKEDPEQQTMKQVKALGADAMFVRCDVSKASDVQNLMDSCIKTYGRLDYAFNNAGIEGAQAITHECSEENWDNTIAVDLKGIWLCMKYEIPQMLKQPGSAIVNCSSVAGLVGFAGLPAYVASKHAVLGLTKTAALEYATQGLRVNAVCPGVIHTAMIDRITGNDEKVEKQFTELEPVGRMGTPQEIAEAVVWLCSGASSFATGVALPVDGGFVAR